MQQAAAKGVTGLVDLEFDQGVRDWPDGCRATVPVVEPQGGVLLREFPGFAAPPDLGLISDDEAVGALVNPDSGDRHPAVVHCLALRLRAVPVPELRPFFE